MLPVLYYYAQTPTVKAKQGGKSWQKLSYCRKKKESLFYGVEQPITFRFTQFTPS